MMRHTRNTNPAIVPCHGIPSLQKMFVLGFKPPLIIPAIHILYLQLGKLVRREIVQTCNVDTDETSDSRFIEFAKGVDTAGFAEEFVVGIGFVDVIGDCVFAGEEPKVLGFDSNVPKSEFPTGGTIASTGFFRGFDVGFEFDGAAETASVVLFSCHLDTNWGAETMGLMPFERDYTAP